jgi:hypothetical protein
VLSQTKTKYLINIKLFKKQDCNMKSFKKVLVAVLLSVIPLITYAQSSVDILKAMKDEMSRNMNNLSLGELKKPYFISYRLTDGNYLQVKASLGAIIVSDLKPLKDHKVDVKVGDYSRDNTNYLDMGNMLSYSEMDKSDLPLDSDYLGIRRAFWLSTDEAYKQAAEVFESKLSALKQQKLTAEDSALADFTKEKPVKLILPDSKVKIEKDKWENVAKQISKIFGDYPELFSSNVSVYIYSANLYYLNTEGTETKVPFNIAAIRINALTQAEDGEPLNDHLLYYVPTPDELPSIDKLKADTKEMAQNLVKLRNAPVFDDTYSGPILFEGQAAAEMFTQKFFSGKSSLVASRKPVFSDSRVAMAMNQMMGESLENKIDKKIISERFSIFSKPKTSNYGQTGLIGSYSVDGEGVTPSDQLAIVEKGLLKTMLSGRVPTSKINKSNGSSGYVLSPGGIETGIGPAVIEVNFDDPLKKEELKKKLIEKAKEEGLEYVFIARKLVTANSGIDQKIDPTAIASLVSGMEKDGGLSSPIYLYKVNVKDGREELVRSASISGVSMNALKKVENVSSSNIVYNTMLSPNTGGLGGIFSFVIGSFSGILGITGSPASFIVPDGIIINELEVQKQKRPITVKLPPVSNPISKK